MSTGDTATWLIGLACGLSAVCSVCLLAAMRPRARAREAVPAGLPWWLRYLWRPAGVMSIPLSGRLPARLREPLQRSLGCCDLDDAFPPERWIAARLLLGAIAACAVSLFGGVVALPTLIASPLAGAAGFIWPGQWLRRRRSQRATSILKDLPSYLDVLTLCVEAGATLTTGLRLAVEKSPPGPLRQVFERVLREIRSGRTRVDSFSRVADIYDLECLSALTAALIHSEGSGMSLGAVLRAQSLQRTAERFARAERIAMQAPVKMLGPLILCIFPCTFIVIGIPILVRILGVVGE